MVSIIYVLDYYYRPEPDGEKFFTSGFLIQQKRKRWIRFCLLCNQNRRGVVCKQRIPSSTLFRHAQLTERFESTCFCWIVYMCVCRIFLYSFLVSTPYWVCVCVCRIYCVCRGVIKINASQQRAQSSVTMSNKTQKEKKRGWPVIMITYCERNSHTHSTAQPHCCYTTLKLHIKSSVPTHLTV